MGQKFVAQLSFPLQASGLPIFVAPDTEAEADAMDALAKEGGIGRDGTALVRFSKVQTARSWPQRPGSMPQEKERPKRFHTGVWFPDQLILSQITWTQAIRQHPGRPPSGRVEGRSNLLSYAIKNQHIKTDLLLRLPQPLAGTPKADLGGNRSIFFQLEGHHP